MPCSKFQVHILGLIIILYCFQISSIDGNPHHDDDTYTPLIQFLKELRRARNYGSRTSSSVLPIKNNESINSDVSDSGIRVGIGGGGGGEGSTSTSNNNGNVNVNNFSPLEERIQQISAQLPTQPPYPIEKVNNGLRTLLGGVNSGSLADILRGSFMFTRNENVQSVANTVIDSIFGKRTQDSTNTN